MAESLAAVPVQVGIGNGPIGLKRKTSLGLQSIPKIGNLMEMAVLLMGIRGWWPPSRLEDMNLTQHPVFFFFCGLVAVRQQELFAV